MNKDLDHAEDDDPTEQLQQLTAADAGLERPSPTGRFPAPPNAPKRANAVCLGEDVLGVEILRSTIAALESIIEEKDAEIASLAVRLKATREAVVRRDRTERELRAALADAIKAQDMHDTRLAAGPTGTLLCLTSAPPRAYPLTEAPILIGSASHCGIRLTPDFVDAAHALITRDGNRMLIEDLDSRHGVYVNAARVAREPLRDGDLVTIGASQFRFDMTPSVGRTEHELIFERHGILPSPMKSL